MSLANRWRMARGVIANVLALFRGRGWLLGLPGALPALRVSGLAGGRLIPLGRVALYLAQVRGVRQSGVVASVKISPSPIFSFRLFA